MKRLFFKIKYYFNLKKYKISNYNINSDGTIDVDGNVDLSDRKLYKIPFQFGRVTGSFICSSNLLESLVGSPIYVGGSFYCYNNKLKDLKGSPYEVGGDFDCVNNKLETVYDATLEIGGYFSCYNNNNLKKLDLLSNVGGYISCDDIDSQDFIGYCKKILIFKKPFCLDLVPNPGFIVNI